MRKVFVLSICALVGNACLAGSFQVGFEDPNYLSDFTYSSQAEGNLNYQPVTTVGWTTNHPEYTGCGRVTTDDVYEGDQSVYFAGYDDGGTLMNVFATLDAWHYFDSYVHWRPDIERDPVYISVLIKPSGTWSDGNRMGMQFHSYGGGVMLIQDQGQIGVYGVPMWAPYDSSKRIRLDSSSIQTEKWYQVVSHLWTDTADGDDVGTNPDVLCRVWVIDVETGIRIVDSVDFNLNPNIEDGHDPYVQIYNWNKIILGNPSYQLNNTQGVMGAAYYDNLSVGNVLDLLSEEDPCLALIASGGGLTGDLNNDCYVDLLDFSVFASDWLGCVHPDDPDCQ
ncbi:MAG: hypothetical protein ACIAQZ_11760 [Sedimentisphaeraceae bacterium JB056]